MRFDASRIPRRLRQGERRRPTFVESALLIAVVLALFAWLFTEDPFARALTTALAVRLCAPVIAARMVS
jgi:hypothetical protein